MPVLEFVGQSARDADNTQVATSRLINLYRERALLGDKTTHVLKSVLGREDFSNVTGPLRAMRYIKRTDDLYIVANAGVKIVDSAGSVSTLPIASGAINDDANTAISVNSKLLTVTSGGTYSCQSGGLMTIPSVGAFSGFGSVCYLKGYTVLTELNGGRFQWSDLADPLTLPGLNFATAEALDDDLIRAVPVGGNLWLLGERSIEIWYVTGLADADAFKPIPGSVIDTGLLGFNLITDIPRGAFLIGDDGVAYLTEGGALSPVSTIPVETAIAEETPTHCYYYEDEGHKFCVIRFANRPAWVFDISAGEWHERGEGASHDAWGVVAFEKAFGKWIAADASGQLSEMTRSNQDSGSTLYRTAVSRTLSMEQQTFRVDKLEFTGRFGVVGPASLSIKVSRDNGHTWGAAKTRTLGSPGDYNQRVTFRNMGQFRQATVQLDMTAPYETPVNSVVNVDIS